MQRNSGSSQKAGDRRGVTAMGFSVFFVELSLAVYPSEIGRKSKRTKHCKSSVVASPL